MTRQPLSRVLCALTVATLLLFVLAPPATAAEVVPSPTGWLALVVEMFWQAIDLLAPGSGAEEAASCAAKSGSQMDPWG